MKPDSTIEETSSACAARPGAHAVNPAVAKHDTRTTTCISVRAFCALVYKSGDLDLRFTPGPSGPQGITGHRKVAARRGPDYQSEVSIEGVVDGLGLRGRIDGLSESPLRLEEIKTIRGAVESVRDNQRALHWAQLKTYGGLYCRTRDLDGIDLRLVYFDIDSATEYHEDHFFSAGDLASFLADGVARYQSWAATQRAHRTERDHALRAMRFPHEAISIGQQTLMRAVTDAIDDNAPLLAEAPTGVGKTIGTLYPALKALGEGKTDKVFYLTAKTSGRREAVKAIDSLRANGTTLPLRVLELTARAKACVHTDKACHGDFCPLAKHFYDRLPGARDTARNTAHLSPDALQTVGASHQVCPYYLSQEMVRWSDVVIGDINYYFDQSALLHGLTRENGWRVVVLADEAHNLIDRARAMYSATVRQSTLRAITRRAPGALAGCLETVERAWGELLSRTEPCETELAEPPAAFCDAATNATSQIGAWLAADPTAHHPQLLNCYFELLGFLRLADTFGEHSFCDLERTINRRELFGEALGELSIRNAVPAPHLAPRIEAAQPVIAFSATLAPIAFYQRMLGFPESARSCSAPSAFSPEQIDVRLVAHIPTTYNNRQRSAPPIADLIAAQYNRRPGNYIAFFSSFAYLDLVANAFAQRHGAITSTRQQAQMSEVEQARLLYRLNHQRRLIVFAVLGGVFSESIDLTGDRLIGAFVTTIGLPPPTDHNQRVADRIDMVFGAGTGARYTYTYPGIRKIVQAAGRVIRSRDDRGSVTLIDRRFTSAGIRALLPVWWRLRRRPVRCRKPRGSQRLVP